MDLISVIIPYFKKKNFIEEAVNSILKQSYSNLEIIIVYDDEDQNDMKYLTKIFGSNKKIKIIVNKENLGAGLSRNKGIYYAQGKFISFLDADDYWHQDKIFKQINFMKENNYQISHTSYEIIDENKNYIAERKAKSFFNFKDILKSCDIGLSTVIIKKDIFNDYQFRFGKTKTKEDFILWLLLAKNGIAIFGIKECLVSWRKNSKSLSSSNIQKILDGYKVYRDYLQYSRIKSLFFLIILSFNFMLKKIR